MALPSSPPTAVYMDRGKVRVHCSTRRTATHLCMEMYTEYEAERDQCMGARVIPRRPIDLERQRLADASRALLECEHDSLSGFSQCDIAQIRKEGPSEQLGVFVFSVQSHSYPAPCAMECSQGQRLRCSQKSRSVFLLASTPHNSSRREEDGL